MAVALWPAGARAQTVARSFEDLRSLVAAGDKVVVSDTAGHRVKGTVAAADENTLSVTTGEGIRTFTRSEVTTVRMSDGLRNGALIGAGVGAGTAVAILGIIAADDGYVLDSAKVFAPLMLSSAGALMGMLIDRAHEGGRVLYASPGQKTTVGVSPILGGRRRGVQVTIGF
jgi:hypothetical protein